jgi:hypothetical protein
MMRIWLGLLISFSVIACASASSGDAWQAMRDRVRAGCLAKAISMDLGKVDVVVDPFGTQSYGAAVLIQRRTAKIQNLAYVCIMDKKTGVFEVGGEFPLK